MTRVLRDRLALKVGRHYREACYKKLWQVRLAAQMAGLPARTSPAPARPGPQGISRRLRSLRVLVNIEHANYLVAQS